MRLTKDQKELCKTLRLSGKKLSDIATEMSITVAQVENYLTYAKIKLPKELVSQVYRKISEADIDEVRRLKALGTTSAKVAEAMGWNLEKVENVCKNYDIKSINKAGSWSIVYGSEEQKKVLKARTERPELGYQEIADLVGGGISWGTVTNICKKAGLARTAEEASASRKAAGFNS